VLHSMRMEWTMLETCRCVHPRTLCHTGSPQKARLRFCNQPISLQAAAFDCQCRLHKTACKKKQLLFWSPGKVGWAA
jgi:hypothetical protein